MPKIPKIRLRKRLCFSSSLSKNRRFFHPNLHRVWHLWQQKNNIAVGRRARTRVTCVREVVHNGIRFTRARCAQYKSKRSLFWEIHGQKNQKHPEEIYFRLRKALKNNTHIKHSINLKDNVALDGWLYPLRYIFPFKKRKCNGISSFHFLYVILHL